MSDRASVVFAALGDGERMTTDQIVEATGLERSAVSQELTALKAAGKAISGRGGWTDANAAMKRALAAEAALAERTKERDAAIAERDMTRLYCAEVASYVCNPIYDKVENREGIAADAKAMATGKMVAHYNDIKKQTKRAIRAEAERDAAIRRAEALAVVLREARAAIAPPSVVFAAGYPLPATDGASAYVFGITEDGELTITDRNDVAKVARINGTDTMRLARFLQARADLLGGSA